MPPSPTSSLVRRVLKAHQTEATAVIHNLNGQAGVFMAPGTGKTLTAIRYIREIAPKPIITLPTLVIGRRDDFLTWRVELIRENANAQLELDEGKEKLVDQVESAMMQPLEWWVLVTYDLCKNPLISQFINRQAWRAVIADELHSIKRWESARTKAVIRCTRHIDIRLGLTGSPITNEIEDVFSQAYFIDNGRTFGTNLWQFKQRYYLKSGYGWYQRAGAKKEITEKLKRFSFHVHEDDVLKLPPKRHVVKAVKMSGMQRRYYEQVLNNWELELADGRGLEIDHVTVQLAKLRQISSGFFYDDEHNTTQLRCTKLDMLRDLLKDEGAMGTKPKVVIWCSHSAEIKMIRDMASVEGWKSVPFFGSNRKVKEASRVAFRTDKTVRLFVGQVDSGVGMNDLVVADTAVYYSNSFRVVSRQQSEARTRRIGSEHHKVITTWDLLTEDGVCRRVMDSVLRGMSLATTILNELKQGVPLRKLLT